MEKKIRKKIISMNKSAFACMSILWIIMIFIIVKKEYNTVEELFNNY